MYAVIRQYDTLRGDVDELVRIDREAFVPVIRAIPGFVSFEIYAGDRGGVASVSMFENETGADESTQKAAAGVRITLAQVLPEPPRITKGPVIVFERNLESPMRFGVIRRITVDDRALEALKAKARVELIPLLKRVPGFSLHAVVDPADGSYVVVEGFAERASVDEAMKIASDWRAKNPEHQAPQPAEVFEATIKLSVTSAAVTTA
jgi:hypothetical protein